ncbi:MAG: hypothetical protein ABUS57_08490 [Pseudomonadota bacterium]
MRGAWWRWCNRTAIVFGAAFITVYTIRDVWAIAHNQLVVGQNYWGQPLFALLQLIVALIAAPFLVRYAIRHWNDTSPPRGGG